MCSVFTLDVNVAQPFHVVFENPDFLYLCVTCIIGIVKKQINNQINKDQTLALENKDCAC